MTVQSQVRPEPVAVSPMSRVTGGRYWTVLFIVVAVASAYLAWCMPRRGWVPHDDGALGESAVRVLQGEVPHRDFAEVYTGGLAYLDAAGFRLFGVNSMTTRWILFAFMIPAIAAMFYVLTRFVAPVAAGACVLVAVAWSFATYTAAMPSWYNLIFAIFATAALLRFIECGNRAWLFVAGLCAGLSFLIKLPGVYLLAAILLFLIFEEQSRPAASIGPRTNAYAIVVGIGLLTALGVLFATVRRVHGAAVIYHFFLPLAAVVALVLAHEPRTGRFVERCRNVLHLWIPVLIAASIPVAIFAFFMRHALAQWIYGTFILPQQRFLTTTTRQPPSLWVALSAIPLLAVLGWAVFRNSSIRVVLWGSLVLGIILLESPESVAYRAGTYSVWMLITPVVLLGCAVVWRRRDEVPAGDVRRTVAVITVLAGCSLVQFPFSVIIYFCYVVPLLMFALVAVLRLLPRMPQKAVITPLLAFFAFHAVFLFGPSGIPFKHDYYVGDDPVTLDLDRAGGLMIPYVLWRDYQPAMQSLLAHAKGDYTYCALDCPDVYFYSGLKNPTPILYDDFDDPHGRKERILRALEGHGVNAIVLEPSLFLGGVSGDLEHELEIRYPNVEKFGKLQVRWK